MNIILFVLSIIASTAIIMIFRQLDAKNRSFDKLSKLYKNIREELGKFSDEKKTELQDFDNCIDTSIDKGSALLEQLNKSISFFNDKNQIGDGNFIKKIGILETAITEINQKMSSIEEKKSFNDNIAKIKKEVFNELNDYKKEIIQLNKELDKKKRENKDNFKSNEVKKLS